MLRFQTQDKKSLTLQQAVERFDIRRTGALKPRIVWVAPPTKTVEIPDDPMDDIEDSTEGIDNKRVRIILTGGTSILAMVDVILNAADLGILLLAEIDKYMREKYSASSSGPIYKPCDSSEYTTLGVFNYEPDWLDFFQGIQNIPWPPAKKYPRNPQQIADQL